MALIKCPECGRDISDKSDKCIQCGYVIRNNDVIKKFLIVRDVVLHYHLISCFVLNVDNLKNFKMFALNVGQYYLLGKTSVINVVFRILRIQKRNQFIQIKKNN